MAQSAYEAITTFITVRHMREGDTFPFASMQIRYPKHDELRDALAKMAGEGLIEPLPDLQYKITKAGFTTFIGSAPSEEDAIKAVMDEIGARGLKPGKSFLWEPLQKGLHEKHLGPTELQPALEKLLANGWLAAGMAPGFYKLTEAGSKALAKEF
jgi:hypothetical protein